MRITVIGSGTLAPSPDRASPCHLVEHDDLALLLDAGPGAVHGLARRGKPWWALTHVVFSHYHTDHFADLPHLLFALRHAPPTPRHLPLRILGPPGLRDRVEALRAAHGEFIVRPGFPVALHEVGPDPVPVGGRAVLRFVPTPHTGHSLAVRLDARCPATGGVLSAGYTGDTGPDPALGEFFAGVDLLISECAWPDPPPAGGHLTPRTVAELAIRVRPRNLALTHLYPPLDPASAPALVRAAGYDGRVLCPRDGESFVVRPLVRAAPPPASANRAPRDSSRRIPPASPAPRHPPTGEPSSCSS